MAFVLLAAALTISPGPDTMLVLRNALRGGWPAGVRTTLGICSGLAVHATLSTVGLSVLLVRSAAAFAVVRSLGAAYLVWLGIQALRSAVRPASRPVVERGSSSYLQGFFTNVLNPKVAVFYLAFLPQFIAPGDPVVTKSFLLAGIHAGMGLVWLSGLSLLVARAHGVLQRAAVRRWLDGVCGAVLVALGLRLALERR